MTIRRVLLWGLPVLFVVSLAFFILAPQLIQRQLQTADAIRQTGWTTYLEGFVDNDWVGYWSQEGDMALDRSGRIWVAGGGKALTGLHGYADTDWISHTGEYWDLAVGLQGEIWAVSFLGGSSVDMFDGKEWRRYYGSDLGLEGQRIRQIEVDSNGRIWVVTVTDEFSESSQVAEIVMRENKAVALFSHPEFTITDGRIKSLDADNQGRLWAFVWGKKQRWRGLNVFDGGTWQRIPDQDVDLQNVVHTTNDDQGTVWVATQCGGVMTYDGTTWTTVVEGSTEPYCGFDHPIDGITLDPQGRVWTWSLDRVQLLKDGAWIVLTNENSDLLEGGIFGLAVDNEDRVWIGTDEGVKMAKLQDAMPIPQKIVQQNRVMFFLSKLMNGMIWFFPSLIAILWLGTYFNLLPGVLVAVSIGLLSVIYFGGGPMVENPSPHYSGFLINPGVFATYGGVIGAVLGGLGRGKRPNALTWSVILAVVGLIIGFAIGIGYFWLGSFD